MQTRKPTIETIKDGLVGLLTEVRRLQREVKALVGAINGFTEKHPLPRDYQVLPPSVATGSFGEKYKTDEPESNIDLLRYEFSKSSDLEAPTKTILAIAKELDAALRDIRAARMDIKAIADDSDLRSDFLEWQRKK